MSRRDKVEEAVREIRDFYDMGRKVEPKRPHKEAYGKNLVEHDARLWQEKASSIQKAREFANPEDGFTRHELTELCRLIREVQIHQDEDKAVFTRSHLIRVLSVRPKRRRRAFQREVIENGWSYAEMEAEIAKRFGSRRHGGRKPRLPRDKAGLLVQVEGTCESWRRWDEAFSALVNDDKHILPAAIQGQIKAVSKDLRKLHLAVIEQLKELHPEREVRIVFRDEETPRKKRPTRRRKRP